MNLILIEPHETSHGGHVSLDGSRARHMRAVLGVRPGSSVRLGVVDGPYGVGTVHEVSDTSVLLQCRFDEDVPERPPVDLLLALPRPKVLKRLLAQIAAIGVGRVMLTNAAKVERNYFDTHLLAPAAYRPLLIEGLQQARDTRLPVVTVHRQLKIFLEDDLAQESDICRLCADPGADHTIVGALSLRRQRRVLLAVGPEGGWTDYEREMFASHGFTAASMGLRSLRSDTACIALLAMAHAGVKLSSVRTFS